MNYISTRGQAASLDFEAVLMAGLARDGGLYVPERWPHIAPDVIGGLGRNSYVEAAAQIMQPLVGEAIPAEEFAALIEAAYARLHPSGEGAARAARQTISGCWSCSTGRRRPSKIWRCSFSGLLMDRSLQRSGERTTILAATSGDTGAAAVEAFKDREAIDLFVLFPNGRISDIQRRQMTTSGAANVHPVAVRGTFDDCQTIVKSLFGDLKFRDEAQLSAVNSINWARIMAQTVYYFTAAAALGSPHRPVSLLGPDRQFRRYFRRLRRACAWGCRSSGW